MTSPRVQIVDYHLGNLFSIRQACRLVGIDAFVSSSPADLQTADGTILPGVGAFGNAMASLREMELLGPLRDVASSGKPLLGICLGMQLLFDESEEFGNNKGLGLLSGRVRRLPDQSQDGRRLRVPIVGWNRVHFADRPDAAPLRDGIADGEFMYFVHSFFAEPADSTDELTATQHGSFRYCSAVRKGNILGVQFHPEKSAEAGLRFYENWARGLG